MYLILFSIFLVAFISVNFAQAESLSTKLSGRILLQIESRGEAWYVNPYNKKRYSLGRPNDAFDLMRNLGTGIADTYLSKIQLADENLIGQDSDSDGLSDAVEDSVGTEKNNRDSDGDGYGDKEEAINGYDPRGPGKLSLNSKFAKEKSGKIFLQVQANGEAWYINPNDYKRYFLGRPADAFNLMKKLGLGISNEDLAKIPVGTFSAAADRDTMRISHIKQIQTALELYFNDNIKYPDNITPGEPIGSFNAIVYMPEMPKNPTPVGNNCIGSPEYSYALKENGQSYELKFCLENESESLYSGVNIATPAGISTRTKPQNLEPWGDSGL